MEYGYDPDFELEPLLITDDELPFYLELITQFNENTRRKFKESQELANSRKSKVLEVIRDGDVSFGTSGKLTEKDIRETCGSSDEENPEDLIETKPVVDQKLTSYCYKPAKDVQSKVEVKQDIKPQPFAIQPEVYVDAGAKLPECKSCSLIFSTVMEYKKHTIIEHGRKHKHKCHTCGKLFEKASFLKQHARFHGKRKYKCSTCDASFAFQAHLKRHLLCHTKERPFTCHLCGESFTQESHVKVHSLSHTEDRDFECITCGKRYKRKASLVVHCRTKTHVS